VQTIINLGEPGRFIAREIAALRSFRYQGIGRDAAA
jgi:hypothetical protein